MSIQLVLSIYHVCEQRRQLGPRSTVACEAITACGRSLLAVSWWGVGGQSVAAASQAMIVLRIGSARMVTA